MTHLIFDLSNDPEEDFMVSVTSSESHWIKQSPFVSSGIYYIIISVVWSQKAKMKSDLLTKLVNVTSPVGTGKLQHICYAVN